MLGKDLNKPCQCSENSITGFLRPIFLLLCMETHDMMDLAAVKETGKSKFDEVQGHLRAQRRPSCERQRHLRGTGHRPAREVSTSKPHNESIKNAHLDFSRWVFFRVRGFA